MKVEQKREMKKRNGETETYNNSDSMEAKNDISKNNLNYSTKVIKFILQMTLLVTIAKWKVPSYDPKNIQVLTVLSVFLYTNITSIPILVALI